MGEWPNRRRSGRWVAVLAAAASSFSTAATARFRKRTAGLEYGALLLALLEDFETRSRPLCGYRQHVDDVSTPSALPNPEIGRLDVNADGRARQLGFLRAAQLYDPRGRLALETRPREVNSSLVCYI